MKPFLLAVTLLAVAAPSIAADVGVSVSIGQPGFYGQINIGEFPQPRVIYAQPVIVHRVPTYVREPIYLRVPPGHAKKWSKHCSKYNACDRRVYFVQDSWYNNVYAPQYRAAHRSNNDRKYRDDRYGKHDNKDKNREKRHGKGHEKD